MVLSFMVRCIKELTPAVISYEKDRAPHDLEEVVSEIATYVNSGTIFFRLAFKISLYMIIFFSIFTRGRIFFWLNDEGKDSYLNGLLQSRITLISTVARVADMAIKLVYYSRDEELIRLGYDVKALREEARLRAVSRN